MIKNLRPPSTQSFMARTIAFKEATTSEKLVPVSNNSLLKNPANNKTEPMPEHGLRPLRRVGDIYGNYIVKTELKAVPVSNRTLLQAKTANPITGTFVMRKSEPMPVPSGISKEYRKLLNLNILPAGYALNKGPKKVELAFLEKLTNDNAKKIVLEFMTNSVAGSIYKPLRIIHGGPKNIEQNAQAKEAYDSAIQEMTEMFQRGQTQGTSVQLVIDKFMGNLRKIYNTPIFNIDDYVNSNDIEEGIERLKRESFKAQQVFGGDREDANGQATQEQMLAVLQNLLNAQQAGVLPDQAAAADVAQAQNKVPVKIDEAAAVGGISPEQEKKQADDIAILQQQAAEEPDEPDEPEVPQAPQEPKVSDKDRKAVEDRLSIADYNSIEDIDARIKKLTETIPKIKIEASKENPTYEIYLLNKMKQEFGIKPKQQFIPPTSEQIDAEIAQTNNKIDALNQVIRDQGDAGGKSAAQIKLLEQEREDLLNLKKERPEFDPKKADYKLPTLQQIDEDDNATNLGTLERIALRRIELDNMTAKDIYMKFPFKEPIPAYVKEVQAVGDTETAIIDKLISTKEGKENFVDFYLYTILPKVIPNDEYKEGEIFYRLEKSLFRYKGIIDDIIKSYEKQSFQRDKAYLNSENEKREKTDMGKEIISSLKRIKQQPAGAAAAVPLKKPLTKAEKAAAAIAAKAEREAGAKIVEAKLASEKAAKEAQSAKIREEELKSPFSPESIKNDIAVANSGKGRYSDGTADNGAAKKNIADNIRLYVPTYNFPLDDDMVTKHNIAMKEPNVAKKKEAIRLILDIVKSRWNSANRDVPETDLSAVERAIFPRINKEDSTAHKRYWILFDKYKQYSIKKRQYNLNIDGNPQGGEGRKSRKSKKHALPKLEVTDEEYKKSTKKLLKREKSKKAFQELLEQQPIKRGATRFSTDELNQIIQSILSSPL